MEKKCLFKVTSDSERGKCKKLTLKLISMQCFAALGLCFHPRTRRHFEIHRAEKGTEGKSPFFLCGQNFSEEKKKMLTHAFIYRTAINSATWITLSLFTTVIYLFIYWLVCLLCLWVGGGTDRTKHINILWYSQFALSYTSLRKGQCMAPYHLACYSKPRLFFLTSFFPAPRQSLTFSHVVLSARISP